VSPTEPDRSSNATNWHSERISAPGDFVEGSVQSVPMSSAISGLEQWIKESKGGIELGVVSDADLVVGRMLATAHSPTSTCWSSVEPTFDG
jgi:hypothetical protein